MSLTSVVKKHYEKYRQRRREKRRARKDKIAAEEKALSLKEQAINRQELVFRYAGDAREVLAANAVFKDCKRGKRCFILGNGPSLKNENITTLADEDVFTVNQAARHPDFAALKTNIHFWADPQFFIVDDSKPEDMELVEVMKKINTPGNKPICFFPFRQRAFVQKYGLDKELNVSYFLHDMGMPEGFPNGVDFCGVTPVFHGVVMWCITLALYMGYSEIYLLGIDTTSILVNIKSFLQQNDSDDYAYKLTENEKLRMQRMLERQNLECQANAFACTLRQYRMFYEYAKERNVKIYNCSSTTLVDSIPRKRLVDVLAGK